MGGSDKRKFRRSACSISADFDYYTGIPGEVDIKTAIPQKGHGIILDISCGGVLITSETRVPAGMPVILCFKIEENLTVEGTIVRTGLLKNNPSEIARMLSSSNHGDSYIAIEFTDPIDESRLEKL